VGGAGLVFIGEGGLARLWLDPFGDMVECSERAEDDAKAVAHTGMSRAE